MVKVAINVGQGEFRLSHKAIVRYFHTKNIPLFFEEENLKSAFPLTYWTISPSERKEIGILDDRQKKKATLQQWKRHNEMYKKYTVSSQTFQDRTDPLLIEIIEELGETASHTTTGSYIIIKEVEEGSIFRIKREKIEEIEYLGGSEGHWQIAKERN